MKAWLHTLLFAARPICGHMYLRVILYVPLEPLMMEHYCHEKCFTGEMESPRDTAVLLLGAADMALPWAE